MQHLYLSEDRVEIATLGGLISVNPSTEDALCIDEYGNPEAIPIELAKYELLQVEKEMEKKLNEIKNALKKLEHIQPNPKSGDMCEKIKHMRDHKLKGRTK